MQIPQSELAEVAGFHEFTWPLVNLPSRTAAMVGPKKGKPVYQRSHQSSGLDGKPLNSKLSRGSRRRRRMAHPMALSPDARWNPAPIEVDTTRT